MAEDDAEYFKLRKEGKIYLSKVFTHGAVGVSRMQFSRGQSVQS